MKNLTKILLICAVVALGLTTFSTTMAAEQAEGQQQKRKGPPAEAFEACANLSEQTACSFTSPRGEATGQCVVPRRGDSSQLVCMPEGHEKRSKQKG